MRQSVNQSFNQRLLEKNLKNQLPRILNLFIIFPSHRSLNMIHTLPEIERSSSPLCNTHNGTSTQSVKRYFSRADDEGMLPLVELPPFLVKMVLEDGIPPLGQDLVLV